MFLEFLELDHVLQSHEELPSTIAKYTTRLSGIKWYSVSFMQDSDELHLRDVLLHPFGLSQILTLFTVVHACMNELSREAFDLICL